MVNLAFACVKSGYDLLPNFKICWWVVHGINSSPFSPVAGTSTVRIMQVVTPPWRRWLSEYSFRVRSALLAITWFSLISLSALAQMEVVEIDTPQFAKSVAGVVNDPSGAALPGVTVEERSEDWKTVLRSTETDDKGRFRFSSNRNQPIYYLQFSRSGFNWLRIKLQLDKRAKSAIVLKMPIGT